MPVVIQVDIDLAGGDSRTYSGTLGYPLNPTLTPDESIRPIRLAMLAFAWASTIPASSRRPRAISDGAG